jgi:hypothetical protein
MTSLLFIMAPYYKVLPNSSLMDNLQTRQPGSLNRLLDCFYIRWSVAGPCSWQPYTQIKGTVVSVDSQLHNVCVGERE